MRRFILTIIFACFSLTMFGTDDLFFAYLKHVPKGDTPVDSVRFDRYYGTGVIINKDEDGESSGIDVFDIEEAPDAKWLWYNSVAQGEVLSAVHRWLLQRQFWRFMWMSHDIPEKDYSFSISW